MTTYEHRLRQIAEEFAIKWRIGKICDCSLSGFNKDVELMLPLAEIAIRREGEAYEEGRRTGKDQFIKNLHPSETRQRKHDLGLIKPTTDGTEAR